MQVLYVLCSATDSLGCSHVYAKVKTKYQGELWAWLINDYPQKYCNLYDFKTSMSDYITKHKLTITESKGLEL